MLFNKQTFSYSDLSNAIRFLSIDAVEKAKSGHPGMPMGMADIATILFTKFLKFNPTDPAWLNRDRFILSNGHGSMLLYSLLYLTGYDLTLEDLKNFKQLHSKTPGHPEFGHTVGVETTTGPLGQGIANAIGMSIAAKQMQAKHSEDLFNHKIYCFLGDGCLMEGISHEACSLAGHLQLNNLIVIFDDNEISIDGETLLSTSDNVKLRFQSYGWEYFNIDGHDYQQIEEALEQAQNINKPVLIAAKTKIGFGSPNKEGSAKAHGSPLGKEEIKLVREKLGWPHKEFEIPDNILKAWRKAGTKNLTEYKFWKDEFAKLANHKKLEIERIYNKELPNDLTNIFAELKREFTTRQTNEATRKSSGRVIEKIVDYLPELFGGSADLSESNNTLSSKHQIFNHNNYSGNYLHYGVREHAMASIMNGMSAYGTHIPYAGTFLIFSDYMRPSIRLAALMQVKVIYILTHDSIGLGGDGPTHQPVEHLAALRAIPNLLVLRPMDSVEVAECWQIALEYQGPSILALSRQNLTFLRTEFNEQNLCKKGAYEIIQEDNPQVTIFATGSEVEIAVKAAQLLQEKHITTRVLSMPSKELFLKQDSSYITQFLCNNSIKVAVEAGINLGWHEIIGPHGIFVGMHSFGASAPEDELYKYFNITAAQIVQQVITKLEKKHD
ncbi:transketolase [Rickettsiales endosymbiont of Stachyamoeba lipophora]|uniref:transketolase n=1 Tax=Rickettsiales endosymbiont of Stachyamoeba lipophora TaxID=2486578 RepID=UPI000F65214A|nr:transketolase [Rickettsiales endosymbiont of Stachyamoeba lipophora]AZL15227.1 transketolase [Rickettsiales endosymbiont of Stachyamoeba lipophora]